MSKNHHKSRKKSYKIALKKLESMYTNLYGDLKKDIHRIIGEIEKDREIKKSFNDIYHTALITSTSVAVLQELKKLKERGYISGYEVHAEYRLGKINPDVFADITTSKKRNSRLILEVENPMIPDRFIIEGYNTSYYLGRIVSKTLRYSPHADKFYIVYPSSPRPSLEILCKILDLFKKDRKKKIKNIYERHIESFCSRKNNGIESNVELSHLDGFLFVGYQGEFVGSIDLSFNSCEETEKIKRKEDGSLFLY